MSRFIPYGDMTAAQIRQCNRDATALVYLCGMAAWQIINDGPDNNTADAICAAAKLAEEMMGIVQDALETAEAAAQ